MKTLALVLTLILSTVTLFADTESSSQNANDPATLRAEIDWLKSVVLDLEERLSAQENRQSATEQKTQILAETTSDLSERFDEAPPFAAPASHLDNFSFTGYGETHYTSHKIAMEEKSPADLDAHRMVFGVHYAFSDRMSVHTEVDYEHSAQEMELEFAYIDFAFREAFNIRAGTMLMPVGPLNETHEPTRYYSVERPYTQTNLTPTTWQEGGIGFFGSSHGFNYRAYVVGGLDATGFTDTSGIRSGRQKVDNGKADDLAVVARAEYTGTPGLRLSASLYEGSAAQDTMNIGSSRVSLWEVDAALSRWGFDLRSEYLMLNVGNASELSMLSGKTIASKMHGWNLEAAYNVLQHADTDKRLMLFARREIIDTQYKVPDGFDKNPAGTAHINTFGAAFYPHDEIVVKATHESWKNGIGEKFSRFLLGLGWSF